MTIKLVDDVYLGTAKYNEGGGTIINNQDLTITANGEYSAGEGYTGIGTATVNVPSSGGDIITAKNATGAVISEGDKVFIEKAIGEWNIKNTIMEENFTKTGSPLVSMLATNFSASNYMDFTGTLDNFTTEDCTVYIKILVTDTSSQQQFLTIDASSINLYVQAGAIKSWNGSSAVGITSVTANTTYWIKYVSKGSNRSVAVSTDGQTYDTPVTFTVGTAGGNTIHLEIGSYAYNRSWYFRGAIDLAEFYIENALGDVVWSAIGTVKTFTGIANEAISVDDAGEVKTVLPDTITVSVTADVDNAEISVE